MFSGFLELNTKEIGKKWIVSESFTVFLHNGKSVTIPKGYQHDRYTFAPNLNAEIPAIVHDYLCEFKRYDDGTICERDQADFHFYCLMRGYGVDEKTSLLYYYGVRFWSFLLKLFRKARSL
jgi:hypothetical protein